MDLRLVLVKRPVDGQSDVPPMGKGHVDASHQDREHGRQMRVQLAAFVLDRVDVHAERKARGRIHREAHQFGLQVHLDARLGCPAPAIAKPFRDPDQLRHEAMQMRRVKCGHHHAPLSALVVAFGAEESMRAGLAEDRLEIGRPSPGGRTIPQDRRGQGRVRHDKHLALQQLQSVERSERCGPIFQLKMEVRKVQLQQVSHNRRTLRAWQRPDVTRWRRGRP